MDYIYGTLLSVRVFSTFVLIVDTVNKQILQIEQKFIKNPNWWEANQLAIYKAWRSWIRNHRRQIHLVAGCRI